jgi:hypothetical protein
MRIWDLPPNTLCRKHLLGEHRELHAIYSVILNNKKGYSKHPETLRWGGKLPALKKRHQILVAEMEKRGYQHNSPLPDVPGKISQDKLINTIEEQEKILRGKNCDCPLKS